MVIITPNCLKNFSVGSLEGPEMVRTENFPLFLFFTVFHENLAPLKVLKCCSSAF